MKSRWKTWLTIWIADLLVGAGLTALLLAQGMTIPARIAGALFAAAFVGWLYFGLWSWRKRRWVRIAATYIVSGSVVLALMALAMRWNQPRPAYSLAGLWIMAAAFLGGLGLIRLLLAPSFPILAVARNLVDEAIRLKIALVFIVLLALTVCIIPVAMDPAERLEYRMQFYLSWSLGITTLLLSAITVAVSCWSICNEQKDRQIYLTLVKPINRAQYLLGKWLGVMMLNLLLVVIAGGGIYEFTKIIETSPIATNSEMDARTQMAQLYNQVLVARATVMPSTLDPGDLDRQLQQRLEKIKLENPLTYNQEILREGDLVNIRQQIVAAWHSIAPEGEQTYVFRNLLPAKQADGEGQDARQVHPLQLRFKVQMNTRYPDEKARIALWINGRPYPVSPDGTQNTLAFSIADYQILYLPPSMIDNDGNLIVRIRNTDLDRPGSRSPGTMSFSPGKDLEVLYWVGGFEGNLIRTLAMIWVRLTFLAMLGTVAGTFLGFPVACLLTALVFFAASSSEFLLDSFNYYASVSNLNKLPLRDAIVAAWGDLMKNIGEGNVWNVLKTLLRLIGETFVRACPSFSRFNPTPLLADGRVVTLELLGQAALSIIGVSTALLWFIGWLIFRRRELARVIV
ncbi:MAG: ABC transporter permease [Phycisphaeraceae bacterium]|nr:ABC transporter permease [Phycisphaeraceae bacterium]